MFCCAPAIRLGDVLGYGSEQAELQSYYRNNVVASVCCILGRLLLPEQIRRLSRAAVEKLGRGLYASVQSGAVSALGRG
ncbi:MAG: hypothetical protein IPO08_17120 [Xanthomonadales bacterium]|nr:hypothetical protein [Xanthomonadales bacterium]